MGGLGGIKGGVAPSIPSYGVVSRVNEIARGLGDEGVRGGRGVEGGGGVVLTRGGGAGGGVSEVADA